jgi:hypothetical protein
MALDAKDRLTLVPQHMDKNPSIQFWSDDDIKVKSYRDIVLRYAKDSGLNYFLQGDRPEWFMVELWESEDRCLEFAMLLEEKLRVTVYN